MSLSEDPRIRVATQADHDALLAVDLDAWTPEAQPGTPATPDDDFFARVGPEDHLVAVAGDGSVVGYVRLGHPTPLASSLHVTEVKGLAVSTAARRRGIGRLLLTAAVEEARRRGARKVSLRVLGTNPAAQALYESLGFEVEGRLREEFLIEGRYVDDILMARRLTTAGPPPGPALPA